MGINITSKICMIKDLGIGGNLFGGNMMAWIDIFAVKHTRMPRFVTKFVDAVEFKKPIKEGSVVDFIATDITKGATSLTFTIQAIDALTNVQYFTTKFVMVCVDNNGQRTKILGIPEWK